MKISTEIGSIGRIVGFEKAIEYCAKAAFDAFDFSMFDMAKYDWANKCILPNDSLLAGKDYLKYVRNLKKIADGFGIVCNQSHAPFPTSCPEIRSFYSRAIECTAEMGGEICIIHPDNDKSAEENAEMYFELLPAAKEYGVKIATENMFNWNADLKQALPAACSPHEDFLRHIKAVDDKFFVACLDIGHAEMKGLNTSAVKMIHTLGDSLKALHIHDNDLWHDSHELPGTMQINFPSVIKALKEIDYSGYFTLEASSFLREYNSENVFDGVKKMADSARNLAEMFENAGE